MLANLYQYTTSNWEFNPINEHFNEADAQLVLCFSGIERAKEPNMYSDVKAKFPNAQISICSTAGEIMQKNVQDDTVVVVALKFDATTIKTAKINIKDYENSYIAGEALVKQMPKENLAYIMVFSDGSLVNGSELVKGLCSICKEHKLLITGGLAGDNAQFSNTLVGLNEQPANGNIIAIGFYGNKLLVGHGSQGGWDIFGVEKEVTKSQNNVLFEIDNHSALDLYKKYLGDEAANLPGSALLFPLSITIPGSSKPIVRTILSIDEKNNSMTFAGDLPIGSKVKFMKANFEKITEAASEAALNTFQDEKYNPVFALLVSCVGRKLVLGPRSEDEVEKVSNNFADNTIMAGFYSNGEISPFNEGGACQLHNQTMTITTFYELP